MYCMYGLDEAGLGPNLGPLVVSGTAWTLPIAGEHFDFYAHFEGVVSRDSTHRGTRLHIADSKLVYAPAKGIGSLELPALALLGVTGCRPTSLTDLIRCLMGPRFVDDDLAGESAFPDFDIALPLGVSSDVVETWISRLQQALTAANVELTSIQSDVVFTRRFNRLIGEFDNKSLVLSTVSLNLLRQLWSPELLAPTLIVSDKHGGRNRYDQLLSNFVEGAMILRLEEGLQLSRYRVNATELRFQVGGESHFPVAAASIVCKYVRELTLHAFNRYWQHHVPGLKPTKGYPLDARRFRDDVRKVREKLAIPDADFWRIR